MLKDEMAHYPKTVTLSRGAEVTLRPLVREDEDKLLQFFRSIPEGDRIFLAHDVTNRAVIRKWARELDYDAVLPIVAEKDGDIIADATLHLNRMGWMRHVGEIRCVVAVEYRRRGLATVMISNLIDNAVLRGLDKIVFEAMGTETGAIQLMLGLGFIKEARLKNHVTDLRGRPHDLVVMTNYVSELWKKMEDLILDSEFEVIP
jgi:RimJ/RimL family protein N-acetyltransferase